MAHGEYALTSSPQQLRDLTKPPPTNNTLRTVLGKSLSLIDAGMAEKALVENDRFSIINAWRTIAAAPVATCTVAHL